MTPEEVAAEHWWWLMEQGWRRRYAHEAFGAWRSPRDKYELFEFLVRRYRRLEGGMTKAGPPGHQNKMGRPVHYDYANIRAWYSMGMTYDQIREICGASKHTVARALEDGGVRKRRCADGCRPVTKSERNEIIAEFKAGCHVYALAERHQRSKVTIYEILRAAGVKDRRLSNAPKVDARAWGLEFLMPPEKRDARFAKTIAATEEGGYHDHPVEAARSRKASFLRIDRPATHVITQSSAA